MSNTAIATSGDSVCQYLSFLLAGQEYGVDILAVQEIKGWERPTRIPHSPVHVLGVVNLRGTVVPIIDLRRRFELAPTESGPTTVVIVVRVQTDKGEQTAGLVVDAVCEVCNVRDQDMRNTPDVGSAINSECVRGLAILEQKMVILLDVNHLVASCLENTQLEVKVA